MLNKLQIKRNSNFNVDSKVSVIRELRGIFCLDLKEAVSFFNTVDALKEGESHELEIHTYSEINYTDILSLKRYGFDIVDSRDDFRKEVVESLKSLLTKSVLLDEYKISEILSKTLGEIK